MTTARRLCHGCVHVAADIHRQALCSKVYQPERAEEPDLGGLRMAGANVQILVVDDEAEVRALLRKCFEREGFQVVEAKDGAELRARIEQHPISLITLDLTLGGEDGLELAREIRAKCNVPIVMISGKGDTIDRVVGLELGADDYIAKPFQLREVLARVRAVLRRYAPAEAPAAQAASAHERYAFEDMVLDVTGRELAAAAVRCRS